MVRKIIDRWIKFYARRVASLKTSATRDLMSTASRPDIISFAGGLPSPESFDLKVFEESMRKILENEKEKAFQYGPTEGFYETRELACLLMKRFGINAHPDEVIITAGAQQALDLLAKIFIDEGAEIIIEAPSYVGAINAFRVFEPNVLAVPLESDGLDFDYMVAELDKRSTPPRFIYVVPDFHNPAGVSLSDEKRKALLQFCRQNEIVIIEDNPYGELCFSGERKAPMKSIDSDVIYLGSLSKIISPGLRVGWVCAPAPVLQKINAAKQGADLCSSSLSQLVAVEYLSNINLDEHLQKIRKLYESRKNAMLAALEEYFPDEASWTEPEGGFFLWVTLDAEVDTGDMISEAINHKVAYVPGDSFYMNGDGSRSMRLSFSNPTPEEIWDGIERLSRVVKEQIALSRSIFGFHRGDEKK